METLMGWDNEEFDFEGKEIVRLPDSTFECPKLSVGDIINLCPTLPNGDTYEFPTQVVKASIDLNWIEDKSNNNPKITTLQYIHLANILEEKEMK